MSGCFGALVGAPVGPGWRNYPSQMGITYYDEEKYGWCGFLWLHDITEPFENLLEKIGIMGGMSGCFRSLMGAPRALAGEITPP